MPNPFGSLTRRLSLGLFLFVPGLVLAGPNGGGTLVIHANPSLVFTSDTQNYCGMSALDSCSAAVTSVAWDPGNKIVFHVIAAFPPGSQPRLKALSFGIDYDPAKFGLAARGSCADFELPDGTWPASGTGTAQSWTTATQTGLLTECYWFAGYAYSEQYVADSTSFALIPHPVQHGVFVDDAFPAAVDTIAAYGTLGFGMSGYSACPGSPGGDSANGGGTPDTPGGSDSDGHGPDSPDNPPDVGPPGPGDVPPTDPRCSFPLTLSVSEGKYLVILAGADSVAFTNTQVQFTVDASDTLRINGYPVLPPRPQPATRMDEQQCERLVGNVPLAQLLVQQGSSWCDANTAFNGQRSALIARASARYQALLDNGVGSEAATAAALAEFRGSSLVSEATATKRLGRPAIAVRYTGFPFGLTSVLTPGDPILRSPFDSSLRCDLVQDCTMSLQDDGVPALVLLRGGSRVIKVGASVVDRFLTTGAY